MPKINKIVENGEIIPFTEDRREKIKALAKKLAIIYEQEPFILGFTQGFYSLKAINVFVCIVGIPPFEQNVILEELKELEGVGIKPLILVGISVDHASNEEKIL